MNSNVSPFQIWQYSLLQGQESRGRAQPFAILPNRFEILDC